MEKVGLVGRHQKFKAFGNNIAPNWELSYPTAETSVSKFANIKNNLALNLVIVGAADFKTIVN